MRVLRSLSLLLAAALPAAAPAAAQQARATRDAEVRAVPEGNVIATVQEGTTWRTGGARAGSTLVTLEGWITATGIGARRDSFPATTAGGTIRLRAEPSTSARILGVFQSGAGIRIIERKGDWARVQRDGWVLNSALANVAATAAATPRPAAPRPADPRTAAPRPVAPDVPLDTAPPAREGALRASRSAPLSYAPGARAIGTLDEGAIVDATARDRGWVKVRVDAWVPESLLVPADPAFAGSLTAADLRLDPKGHEGQVVRWAVQVVSLQTADPLRRALQPDEPYLLAMGPSGENAILYLAVPPALLEDARRLPPLAEVLVTARIRNGRSQPTGAPVLDLLTLTRR